MKMAQPALASTESELERKCRAIAEKRGFVLVKFSGVRGWPDRLLLRPGGRVTWIEFKRLGEKPRPLQVYVLELLTKLGFRAVWVDTMEKFLY